MSVRAVFVLGFFVALAGLLHGGIYTAGHDFIVNRFTGEFRFVPAEEEGGDATPARPVRRAPLCLDLLGTRG